MKRSSLPILTAAFALATAFPVASAADQDGATLEKDKLDVTVSILPHAFLVKAIGGEHVNVTTLVGAGQDPHQFNITPAQTIALSASDVFFSSDMPFETQFILKIRAGAKHLKIVKINRGITLMESSHDHHDHGHDHGAATDDEKHADEGHEGEHDDHHGHDHSGPDPHTWTSPALLGLQAITVQETLTALAPDHADAFADNLDTLFEKILAADTEISERLKPHKGKEFFVFHPAFGYFAKQYDLIEKSIEVEGKKPTPKQLLAIISEAGAAKVKTLFIEPQFDNSVTGEVARQIGAKLATVDPLTEDILTSLTEFSKALADSYSAE